MIFEGVSPEAAKYILQNLVGYSKTDFIYSEPHRKLIYLADTVTENLKNQVVTLQREWADISRKSRGRLKGRFFVT